jgi:hypothetical protein
MAKRSKSTDVRKRYDYPRRKHLVEAARVAGGLSQPPDAKCRYLWFCGTGVRDSRRVETLGECSRIELSFQKF